MQTVGKLEGRVGQLDAELASTQQLAEKSREETEAVRKRLQMVDEVRRGGAAGSVVGYRPVLKRCPLPLAGAEGGAGEHCAA